VSVCACVCVLNQIDVSRLSVCVCECVRMSEYIGTYVYKCRRIHLCLRVCACVSLFLCVRVSVDITITTHCTSLILPSSS
jgi:hypothetical protein